MRIALTGAGGTGKGTLGEALSKKYNIPFIPSHISETGMMLGMNNYKDVKSHEDAMLYQYSIMFGQIYQERALQIAGIDYICERCVYDYIPYFIDKGLDDKRYFDIINKWADENYDVIIYLPRNFVPADKQTNTWKERDEEKRLFTDTTIKDSLIKDFKGEVLTIKSSTPDEKVKEVSDFLLSHFNYV